MILIEFLLAPTVPSAPRPKKRARTVLGSSVEKCGSHSRLVWVTSSLMPTVKWFFGLALAASSRTAFTMAGVNSLEERPYRPPMTRGVAAKGEAPPATASARAVTTSWYSGSPAPPGSLVRSRTARVLTVLGRACTKCSTEKGRKRRTFKTPTFSPRAVRYSTASCAASAPEPIRTTTRSASGAPT